MVDAVVTLDDDRGAVAVFMVNRSLDAPTTVSIDLSSLEPVHLAECVTLADDDPNASNTLENEDRVTPAPNRSARIENGTLILDLPAISWTALQLTK
jgi:alpha-N-arabinofuranosidase